MALILALRILMKTSQKAHDRRLLMIRLLLIEHIQMIEQFHLEAEKRPAVKRGERPKPPLSIGRIYMNREAESLEL
jgi:hypothetical protein